MPVLVLPNYALGWIGLPDGAGGHSQLDGSMAEKGRGRWLDRAAGWHRKCLYVSRSLNVTVVAARIGWGRRDPDAVSRIAWAGARGPRPWAAARSVSFRRDRSL